MHVMNKIFSPLGAPLMSHRPNEFATGDAVKVEVDIEVLKLMQEHHGGWNDMMMEVPDKQTN